MNEYIFLALLVFGGVGYLWAGMGHFSRKKLSDAHSALLLRVQTLESRQAAPTEPPRKKGKPQKEKEISSGPSEEILAARKEIAHLKEQVQALRQEERAFGQRLKEAVTSKENEIFKLKADLDQVILDLKAAGQQKHQSRSEQPSDENRAALSEAQQTVTELKRRLASAERTSKTEAEANEKLRRECSDLQAELRKWTAAAQDTDGKVLDPVLFRRWKSRALTARQMYQMMRQLREMSDLKLATYQESVVQIASFVLKTKGYDLPTLQQGEIRSDRYLAAALDALLSRSDSQTAVHGMNDALAVPVDTAPLPEPQTN